MAMTLEIIELLDELASASAMIGYATSGAERNNHKAARDKIKAEIIAHLTQPAQAVDVGAVADALENEYLAVANGEKKPGKLALEPLVRAVQTIRALAGEQTGLSMYECNSCGERPGKPHAPGCVTFVLPTSPTDKDQR